MGEIRPKRKKKKRRAASRAVRVVGFLPTDNDRVREIGMGVEKWLDYPWTI